MKYVAVGIFNVKVIYNIYGILRFVGIRKKYIYTHFKN